MAEPPTKPPAKPSGSSSGRVGKGSPKVGGNEPHEPKPLPRSKRSKETCRNCARSGRPCRHHGGKATGPRTAEGKKEARQNATKHGLYSDPLVFLENLDGEARAKLDSLVRELITSEFGKGAVVSHADLVVARDLVLADLIATRGIQYLTKEWTTLYGEDGRPLGVAQSDALAQWGGLARLKASLRAALRQGTGERGDPNRVTAAEATRRRLQDIFSEGPEVPK